MGLQARQLSGDKTLTHYFLCNYIPQSRGSDKLSKSLLGFKKALHPHKQAWIDCSYSELKNNVDLKRSLILRALGSEEVNISFPGKPLDELGKRLAETFKGSYEPRLLSKTKVVPRMKQLLKAERERVLTDVYQFSLPTEKGNGILNIR